MIMAQVLRVKVIGFMIYGILEEWMWIRTLVIFMLSRAVPTRLSDSLYTETGLGAPEVVAGSGVAGNSDGPRMEATFASPWGIAVTPDGNILVAGNGAKVYEDGLRSHIDQSIRYIDMKTGMVTTLRALQLPVMKTVCSLYRHMRESVLPKRYCRLRSVRLLPYVWARMARYMCWIG